VRRQQHMGTAVYVTVLHTYAHRGARQVQRMAKGQSVRAPRTDSAPHRFLLLQGTFYVELFTWWEQLGMSSGTLARHGSSSTHK